MGRIRKMPPALADLVKAEEIAQNPASIVKELVENALDAGAKRIEVEIEGGGVQALRCADDGSGMPADDAALAFEANATSKLYEAADLRTIRTMGFRGEALASVGRVSHAMIQTRQREDSAGSRVVASYGDVGPVESCARTPGTTVALRGLFANVPARLEFLKAPHAEARRVLEVMRAAALARPDVSFRLASERDELLNVRSVESTLERIGQVWGDGFAQSLMRVSGEFRGVRLDGYVSRPSAAVRRSTRSALFLNDRPFSDRGLPAVARDVMKGRLVQGLRPEVVLFFEMDPATVDVNVAPDKSEVRFRDEESVKATLIGALRRAIDDPAAISGSTGAPSLAARPAQPPAFAPAPRWKETDVFASVNPRDGAAHEGAPPVSVVLDLGLEEEAVRGEQGESVDPVERWGGRRLAEPVRLFQSRNTFVVAELEEGFLFLDQHAVHERIRYEELCRGTDSYDVQPLLMPEVVDASRPETRLILEEMQGVLASVGFEVDPMGPREWVVRAVPAWSSRKAPGRALKEAIEALSRPGVRLLSKDAELARERLLYTVACHSAVRAGQPLSPEEMRALYESVQKIDLGFSDVHGRAGAVWVGHDELVSRLQRGGLPG